MYLKFIYLIATLTTVVFCAPIRSIPPRTITGNIQSVEWYGEHIFDAQMGLKSNAHYNIQLSNARVILTDPQENFLDSGSIGEYPELTIFINRIGDTILDTESKPLLALAGDSIKIVGYKFSGDEFGQAYMVDTIFVYKKSTVVSRLKPEHTTYLQKHNYHYVTIGAQSVQELKTSASFSLNGRSCVFKERQTSSVRLGIHK